MSRQMDGWMDYKLRLGRDLGAKSDEFTLEMSVLWCHWINGWWPYPRSWRKYEPREQKMFPDWKYRIFIFTLFPWASVFPFVKNSWRNFENVTFHFRLRFLGVSQLIELKWWDKQITHKTRIKMLSSWCMQCHFWTKSKPWYRAGNSMEKGQ